MQPYEAPPFRAATPPPRLTPLTQGRGRGGQRGGLHRRLIPAAALGSPRRRLERAEFEVVPGEGPRVHLGHPASADSDTLIAATPVAQHFSPVAELRADGHVFVEKRVVQRSGSVKEVFRALFAETSPFLAEHHRLHGEYTPCPHTGHPLPLQLPPWQHTAAHLGWREYQCTTVVKAPFSQHTRYVERQYYAHVATPGGQALIVHNSAQTPDVMFGGVFRCEGVVVFEESGGAVTVESFGRVHMLASTMMRWTIERTGTGEMRTSYADYVSQAEEELKRAAAAPRRRSSLLPPQSRPRSDSQPAAASAPPAARRPAPLIRACSVVASAAVLSVVASLLLVFVARRHAALLPPAEEQPEWVAVALSPAWDALAAALVTANVLLALRAGRRRGGRRRKRSAAAPARLREYVW